jgi:hypothetical protein
LRVAAAVLMRLACLGQAQVTAALVSHLPLLAHLSLGLVAVAVVEIAAVLAVLAVLAVAVRVLTLEMQQIQSVRSILVQVAVVARSPAAQQAAKVLSSFAHPTPFYSQRRSQVA